MNKLKPGSHKYIISDIAVDIDGSVIMQMLVEDEKGEFTIRMDNRKLANMVAGWFIGREVERICTCWTDGTVNCKMR